MYIIASRLPKIVYYVICNFNRRGMELKNTILTVTPSPV